MDARFGISQLWVENPEGTPAPKQESRPEVEDR